MRRESTTSRESRICKFTGFERVEHFKMASSPLGRPVAVRSGLRSHAHRLLRRRSCQSSTSCTVCTRRSCRAHFMLCAAHRLAVSCTPSSQPRLPHQRGRCANGACADLSRSRTMATYASEDHHFARESCSITALLQCPRDAREEMWITSQMRAAHGVLAFDTALVRYEEVN